MPAGQAGHDDHDVPLGLYDDEDHVLAERDPQVFAHLPVPVVLVLVVGHPGWPVDPTAAPLQQSAEIIDSVEESQPGADAFDVALDRVAGKTQPAHPGNRRDGHDLGSGGHQQ